MDNMDAAVQVVVSGLKEIINRTSFFKSTENIVLEYSQKLLSQLLCGLTISMMGQIHQSLLTGWTKQNNP